MEGGIKGMRRIGAGLANCIIQNWSFLSQTTEMELGGGDHGKERKC